MYNSIFAKSFSRYERKGFGCCGLVLCFVLAFIICSTFQPHSVPLSLLGDAVNLEFSIDAVQDIITNIDSKKNLDSTAVNSGSGSSQLLMNSAEPMQPVQDKSLSYQSEVVKKMVEPLCRKMEGGADYCEAEGDVRIEVNSSTIFVVKNHQSLPDAADSWTIQPYPRAGMPGVKYWTVKVVDADKGNSKIPMCTQNHSEHAILFSLGGYTGNHFHDFADLLFPLYTASFKKEMHFLASDIKTWWIWKFQQILSRLSRHQVVDISQEKGQVLCYPKVVVGLKLYKPLIIDQSEPEYATGASVQNFREVLRRTYSLRRKTAMKSRTGDKTHPRLMIVSRSRTRILTNEGEVSQLARNLGFEVVTAEAVTSTDLSRFAGLVNSCDVMMGIHGAGLTNMVFLPDDAVLIQLLPLGEIDIFAKQAFGDPAPGMKIQYMEYKISTKESSLSQQYPSDDPVLKDPMSIHRKGWNMIKTVYLDNQNITVDVTRFQDTLVEVMSKFLSK